MAKPAYGYQHRKERAIAIAAMTDGMPCPFCRRPMYRKYAHLLDYDHVIPIMLGGVDGPKRLSHRRCNRSVGASLGNRYRALNHQPTKAISNRGNAKAIIKVKNNSRRLPKW